MDADGAAWILTEAGVSKIGFREMTLKEKAASYEAEIDSLIKRMLFGCTSPVLLGRTGNGVGKGTRVLMSWLATIFLSALP
ncbi:MAG: hypothetical protein M2R45_02126 [Verrucomicrobia subdivision 3 bacterium]|nr:hypothetical protein [Limisphaerales bacterium]MCS1413817.1 hypothetical protein [Limisphaerales bacterium]